MDTLLMGSVFCPETDDSVLVEPNPTVSSLAGQVTEKTAGVSSGGSSLSHDVTKAYAFMFAFTASAVIGNARTRAPQALKIALPSAGAITVTAGSPTPVGFSPLAMTLTATSGIWLIRKGV